jgi:hypothetical protein
MQVRGFLFYNFLHAGRVPGVLKNLNPSHMGLPFLNPYPQKKKKKKWIFRGRVGRVHGFLPTPRSWCEGLQYGILQAVWFSLGFSIEFDEILNKLLRVRL